MAAISLQGVTTIILADANSAAYDANVISFLNVVCSALLLRWCPNTDQQTPLTLSGTGLCEISFFSSHSLACSSLTCSPAIKSSLCVAGIIQRWIMDAAFIRTAMNWVVERPVEKLHHVHSHGDTSWMVSRLDIERVI